MILDAHYLTAGTHTKMFTAMMKAIKEVVIPASHWSLKFDNRHPAPGYAKACARHGIFFSISAIFWIFSALL